MSRSLIRAAAITAACVVSAVAGYHFAGDSTGLTSTALAEIGEAREQTSTSQDDGLAATSEAHRPRTPEELALLKRGALPPALGHGAIWHCANRLRRSFRGSKPRISRRLRRAWPTASKK